MWNRNLTTFSRPLERPSRIVIPKRGISREESGVALPAASRFLAEKTGFGMTRSQVFSRNLHDHPSGGVLNN
jgi:hypothetical protein